jgi:hypothetical protein
MSRTSASNRFITLVLIAGVAVVLVVLARFYHSWSPLFASLSTCVFGKDTCSTAAATWLLCVVTLSGFIAAYVTYRLELSTRLVQFECNHILDPPRYAGEKIDAHGQETEIFIYSERPNYIRGTEDHPLGFKEADYRIARCDFLNVGRWAMLDAHVQLTGTTAHDVVFDSVRVPLGYLTTPEQRTERFNHVRIYLHKDVVDLVTVRWSGQAEHDGRRFRFRPGKPPKFAKRTVSLSTQLVPEPSEAASQRSANRRANLLSQFARIVQRRRVLRETPPKAAGPFD